MYVCRLLELNEPIRCVVIIELIKGMTGKRRVRFWSDVCLFPLSCTTYSVSHIQTALLNFIKPATASNSCFFIVVDIKKE